MTRGAADRTGCSQRDVGAPLTHRLRGGSVHAQTLLPLAGADAAGWDQLALDIAQLDAVTGRCGRTAAGPVAITRAGPGLGTGRDQLAAMVTVTVSRYSPAGSSL